MENKESSLPILDIEQFSKINRERAAEGFNTYKNVPITYWTTALAGEVGELCNMIKKIERVEHGGIDGGSSYTAATLTTEDLKEEVGGIFIYLDLLSGLLGINLTDAIIHTFNSKSEKYKFAQFYPPQPSPSTPLPETGGEEDHFATIKMAVGNIFWNHIQMSADGKAIEGNPAVHRIAEYIVHNFLPIVAESENALVDAFFRGASRMKDKCDELEAQLSASQQEAGQMGNERNAYKLELLRINARLDAIWNMGGITSKSADWIIKQVCEIQKDAMLVITKFTQPSTNTDKA